MDTGKDKAAAAPAAELAAALEAYRTVIENLIEVEWDLERYRVAGELLMQMQEHARRMPSLQPEWLEVHISHFEFTHALWEIRGALKGLEAAVASHAKHAQALERLQARCAEGNG